jgi:hypothetical protein
MIISISLEEKLRLNFLTGKEVPFETNKKFGVSFIGIDLMTSETLHTWLYKIEDNDKFMSACTEHEIEFEYMNTTKSIKDLIVDINNHILSSIAYKSIFDEVLNDYITYYNKSELEEPLSYNGRVIDCPVYYSSFHFKVTDHFTSKEFTAFKKELNGIILLDIVANIAKIETSMFQSEITPNDNHKKLFTIFDGKERLKDPAYVIQFIKSCNADVRFLVANLAVYNIENNNVFFKFRLGSEFEFKNNE